MFKKIISLMFILAISMLILGCGSDNEVTVEKIADNPIKEVIIDEPIIGDEIEDTTNEEVVEEPETEELIEEPIIETEQQDEEELVVEDEEVEETKTKEIVEEIVEEESTNTHTINFVADGFEPDELTIKVGDTVEWKNTRTGNLDLAMVIGAQQCTKIKSGVLKTDETFSWTFDKAETCMIVDGITTTQLGTVIVEE